jgi:hypothetical protein
LGKQEVMTIHHHQTTDGHPGKPRQSNLPIIIDSFVGFGKGRQGQGKRRLKKFLHFGT